MTFEQEPTFTGGIMLLLKGVYQSDSVLVTIVALELTRQLNVLFINRFLTLKLSD